MSIVPVPLAEAAGAPPGEDAVLDQVFAALADPVRRSILTRLDAGTAPVSELAEPYDMSLQAVSKHIQVLVRAGLVAQERTGRIARCRLDAGPIYAAAVWLNRYSKYWQEQFDLLAAVLQDIEAPPAPKRDAGSRDKPRRRSHPRKPNRRAKS